MRLIDVSSDKLKSNSYKEEFGAIVEDLKLDHSSIYFYPLFLLRRLLYSAEIVLFYDYPILQLGLIIITSLLPMMLYLVIVRPFESNYDNLINIYNEFILLFGFCSAFIMNTMNISEFGVQIWGYFLTVLLLSSLLTTWILIMPTTVKQAIESVKDCIWGNPDEEDITDENAVYPDASNTNAALNENIGESNENKIQNTEPKNTETGLIENPRKKIKKKRIHPRSKSTFEKVFNQNEVQDKDAELNSQRIQLDDNIKVQEIEQNTNEPIIQKPENNPTANIIENQESQLEEPQIEVIHVKEKLNSAGNLIINQEIQNINEIPEKLPDQTQELNLHDISPSFKKSDTFSDKKTVHKAESKIETEKIQEPDLNKEPENNIESKTEIVKEVIPEPVRHVEVSPQELFEKVSKKLNDMTTKKFKRLRQRKIKEKLTEELREQLKKVLPDPKGKFTKNIDEEINNEIEEIKEKSVKIESHEEFQGEIKEVIKNNFTQEPMEFKSKLEINQEIVHEKTNIEPMTINEDISIEPKASNNTANENTK